MITAAAIIWQQKVTPTTRKRATNEVLSSSNAMQRKVRRTRSYSISWRAQPRRVAPSCLFYFSHEARWPSIVLYCVPFFITSCYSCSFNTVVLFSWSRRGATDGPKRIKREGGTGRRIFLDTGEEVRTSNTTLRVNFLLVDDAWCHSVSHAIVLTFSPRAIQAKQVCRLFSVHTLHVHISLWWWWQCQQ